MIAVNKFWPSGVVFSRDPITGNPAQVVINANFGLGEVRAPSTGPELTFLHSHFYLDIGNIFLKVKSDHSLQSVVAGVSEADTITLSVNREKNLTISDKKIGRKQEAIFVAGKSTFK